MSLINRMLKDLDSHPAKGDFAPIYQPPSRRLPSWYWWILVLLPLSLWLWWQPLQQHLHPATMTAVTSSRSVQIKPAQPTADVVTPVMPLVIASAAVPIAVPVSSNKPATESTAASNMKKGNEQQEPEKVAVEPTTVNAPDVVETSSPSIESDSITPPEPTSEMYVEEQKMSAGEIAALERRKYQQAIARRDNVAAKQALLQVLANDPLDLNSRKQLAALYYGENQLNASLDTLQQGVKLLPTNADLRLLIARVDQAMGDKQAALRSLQAVTPSADNNIDFYALRAALAQQLGQKAEAGYSYQALLRAQPTNGRWWLGLAISQDQRGLTQAATQSYRRALLDNQIGAASRHFAQQRIQKMEP
jgi:MSHA biogenesis protein MshN